MQSLKEPIRNYRLPTVFYIPILSHILKILEICPILSYFAVFYTMFYDFNVIIFIVYLESSEIQSR